MLSEAQKELLGAIGELHKLETRTSTLLDFKAVVVETRSTLIKVQGELLGNAIKEKTTGDALGALLGLFKTAIDACNSVAMFSDVPTMNEKMLASFLVAQGNFAGIEAFLTALK